MIILFGGVFVESSLLQKKKVGGIESEFVAMIEFLRDSKTLVGN